MILKLIGVAAVGVAGYIVAKKEDEIKAAAKKAIAKGKEHRTAAQPVVEIVAITKADGAEF